MINSRFTTSKSKKFVNYPAGLAVEDNMAHHRWLTPTPEQNSYTRDICVVPKLKNPNITSFPIWQRPSLDDVAVPHVSSSQIGYPKSLWLITMFPK